MQANFYISLSAQMSLQRRLDTIAHNVANANTTGFRAEKIKFETMVSDAGAEPVAFSSKGDPRLSTQKGELTKTDGPLDVAIEGDAWLGVQTPSGLAYTRDGRMRMTETGDLQTLDGHPVLDGGGTWITLDPNGGPVAIARDGAISQGGRRTGVIGLFSFGENAVLQRGVNATVTSSQPAEPVLEFGKTGLAQGFIERANVNPISEISRLIAVTRAFDAVATANGNSESTLLQAIRSLAGAR